MPSAAATVPTGGAAGTSPRRGWGSAGPRWPSRSPAAAQGRHRAGPRVAHGSSSPGPGDTVTEGREVSGAETPCVTLGRGNPTAGRLPGRQRCSRPPGAPPPMPLKREMFIVQRTPRQASCCPQVHRELCQSRGSNYSSHQTCLLSPSPRPRGSASGAKHKHLHTQRAPASALPPAAGPGKAPGAGRELPRCRPGPGWRGDTAALEGATAQMRWNHRSMALSHRAWNENAAVRRQRGQCRAGAVTRAKRSRKSCHGRRFNCYI